MYKGVEKGVLVGGMAKHRIRVIVLATLAENVQINQEERDRSGHYG